MFAVTKNFCLFVQNVCCARRRFWIVLRTDGKNKRILIVYIVGTATIMDMPGKTGFKIVSFKYLKWHAKTLWKVVLKVANPMELYKHPISL